MEKVFFGSVKEMTKEMLTPEQQDILKTKWIDWYIKNTQEILKKHPKKKVEKLLNFLKKIKKWEK